MTRTIKDPAAELLTLAGGYLLTLEAILRLSGAQAHAQPDSYLLPEAERLEAITELARAALEHREPHLSEAALACIQHDSHASNPLGEQKENGRATLVGLLQPVEPVLSDSWPYQDHLLRLVASGIARATGQTLADGKPLYEWTTYGRRVCWRFANTTPMAWAEAMAAKSVRYCVVCGRDMHRKRGAARHADGKRFLCKGCAVLYTMDTDGQPHAMPT